MIEIRRDAEIHAEDGGWFKARWHFSFDRYRDPAQMGIGPLRVFNDDRLVPGAEWPMHPHADVEGLTYVVEGTFEHADSLGNDGRLGPGGVQRMTLGSGARRNPLFIAITTAGVKYDITGEESICYQRWQYGCKVASGEIDDPYFFMSWYGAPDRANYKDPAVWAAESSAAA